MLFTAGHHKGCATKGLQLHPHHTSPHSGVSSSNNPKGLVKEWNRPRKGPGETGTSCQGKVLFTAGHHKGCATKGLQLHPHTSPHSGVSSSNNPKGLVKEWDRPRKGPGETGTSFQGKVLFTAGHHKGCATKGLQLHPHHTSPHSRVSSSNNPKGLVKEWDRPRKGPGVTGTRFQGKVLFTAGHHKGCATKGLQLHPHHTSPHSGVGSSNNPKGLVKQWDRPRKGLVRQVPVFKARCCSQQATTKAVPQRGHSSIHTTPHPIVG